MDKVLHASKCGFPCLRHLFYSVNEPKEETSASSRTQRIFDVGTALEPVIVQWLRNDGWEVEYNQGSQNAELEVNVPVKGGVLVGHHDCIISKPNGPHNVLADIKTMNERSYTLWKKEGSMKSKPQYVKQIHVYAMGLMKLGRTIEKLCIIGVNKNNSEMSFDFFDFDEAIADEILSMSEKLFALDEAPIENCPAESWCCNYCEFSDKCSLFGLPPMLHDSHDNSLAFTDADDVISAMKDLIEARSLAKQAQELEDKAKDVLYENIKQKGLTSLEGGGYVCTINERSSKRFDATGFRKAHPDIAQEFMKESVSTIFEIKEV